MLPAVAWTTGRKNVVDPIGPAPGEWHAMIRLKRRSASAVRAAGVVSGDERHPLLGGVLAFGRALARAPIRPPGATDLRVRPEITSAARSRLDRMLRVPRVARLRMLLTVTRPPTAHRRTRLVRVTSHPRAPIGATALRILERHARSHTERAFACP